MVLKEPLAAVKETTSQPHGNAFEEVAGVVEAGASSVVEIPFIIAYPRSGIICSEEWQIGCFGPLVICLVLHYIVLPRCVSP